MSEVIRASLPELVTATADTHARTITGIATYFGVAANASAGRVVFERGSLSFPDDLRRVKLCLDHDVTRAVGYATAANVSDDRVEMTFYLPETPEGDDALARAANGLRDGLSVGAYIEPGGARYQHGTKTMHVTSAVIREVSLTSMPAFDAARITDVQAQNHTPTTPTPTDGETEMNTENETPENADTPAFPPPDTVPFQFAPVMPAASAPATIEAAAETVVNMLASGASAQQINAALTPIKRSNDAGHGFIDRPDWLGELWTARRRARPLIDSITRKKLGRTTKVQGWRWKNLPTVGEYAGDMAEVHTSDATTEAIEAAVKRIAAAWQIDRIYVDMGDPSMISALFEAAVEDYAKKTEAAVVTDLLAAATDIGDPEDLPAILVTLGAKAAKIGSNIDFVAFGADQWTKFTALKKDEVPWWLGGSDNVRLGTASGSVNGLRLFCDESLSSGTVLAGDARCATYYENGDPLQFNALDISHGAIEIGLFGYYSDLVNEPNALFKVEA